MTTIYDTDDDGNIIVVFDSRWRFPELLGYSPDDPQYKLLQGMWEETTGEKIEENGASGHPDPCIKLFPSLKAP